MLGFAPQRQPTSVNLSRHLPRRGAERGSAMSHFHLPRVAYRHLRYASKPIRSGLGMPPSPTERCRSALRPVDGQPWSDARRFPPGPGNSELGAIALAVAVRFPLSRFLASRALATWLATRAVLEPAVPDLGSIGPLVEFLEILGVGLSTHCEITIRDMKMESGVGIPAVGITS